MAMNLFFKNGGNGMKAAMRRGEPVTPVAPRIRGRFGRAIFAGNLAILAGVFFFDSITPADNVSICFAYAIPIVLSILEGGRRPFLYAGIATVLSVTGSFIQPPNDAITLTFVANRVIAIGTQWAMALLVRYRLAVEEALNRSLQEQRETVERQQRFIAMLSHEIRTPLTVVDGQAYRLIKLSRTSPPEDIERRAQKVRDAAARVNGIINAVLASASVGEKAIQATPKPVDPKALLTDVVQNAVENGATTISCDLDGLPPRIEADPTLLFQIFENILSNAIKYSAPGSPITVTGASRGAEVTVEVTDRGRGIDPAELPKLFTPYYRGGNSRGVPGAGIGLYLVDRFVSAHGGSVSIASRVGEGTTVTVRLPRSMCREKGAAHA